MPIPPFAQLLILPEVHCTDPECGQQLKEVIGQLKGRNTIPCPYCGTMVDIKKRQGEIEDLLQLAAELDKIARARK